MPVAVNLLPPELCLQYIYLLYIFRLVPTNSIITKSLSYVKFISKIRYLLIIYKFLCITNAELTKIRLHDRQGHTAPLYLLFCRIKAQ